MSPSVASPSAVPIDGSVRANALTALLNEMVDLEAEREVDEQLDRIRVYGEQLFGGGDLEELVRWSSTLDRVSCNLRGGGELGGHVTRTVALELRSLDRLVSRLGQRRDVEQRAGEAVGVRGRVFELICARPGVRSGQIAEALDLHPSQVSRAVRELRESGRVVEQSSGAADGRAVAYAPASDRPAAAA